MQEQRYFPSPRKVSHEMQSRTTVNNDSLQRVEVRWWRWAQNIPDVAIFMIIPSNSKNADPNLTVGVITKLSEFMFQLFL